MEHEGPPRLHALVGYVSEPYGLIRKPLWLPLEDAVDYARFGWIVLVDPQDERDLAMWHIFERSLQTTGTRPK